MSDDKKVAKRHINNYKQLDQEYIDAYVNNPKAGKTKALQSTSYVGEFASQQAARMHKRLASRIHDAFTDKIKDLEGGAIANIEQMLQMDIKELGSSNMLNTCKIALEFAGRKQSDTLVIKKDKTIEDIDSAIASLQAELQEPQAETKH